MSPCEIERKFLIHELPDVPPTARSMEIKQGYLTSGADTKEVRVRQIGNRFLLGVKEGSGVVRAETEVDLTRDQFDQLWDLTDGWRLIKTRHFIPYGNLTIELDVYEGRLKGLVVAEVEFSTVEEAELFETPPWFGRDVTEEISLKNSRLARDGLPADITE